MSEDLTEKQKTIESLAMDFLGDGYTPIRCRRLGIALEATDNITTDAVIAAATSGETTWEQAAYVLSEKLHQSGDALRLKVSVYDHWAREWIAGGVRPTPKEILQAAAKNSNPR